jgi:hypothetical protein
MIARVQRRFVRALVVPVLLAALASAGCDIVTADLRHEETATWQKTYSLDANGRVELGNTNGKIRVERSSGNTVEVSALKKARGATPEQAKAALDRVSFFEHATSTTVKVETKVAPLEGIVFNAGNLHVEYTVKVPDGVELRVNTTNGGIEILGMKGHVVAQTTNGGVEARDVSGRLEASTVNGGLDIDLAQVSDGGVRLSCVNGGINVKMPRDAKATISASISNGGISSGDLPIEATGENTRRRLEGRMNGGGPRLHISGTNGGITLSGR